MQFPSQLGPSPAEGGAKLKRARTILVLGAVGSRLVILGVEGCVIFRPGGLAGPSPIAFGLVWASITISDVGRLVWIGTFWVENFSPEACQFRFRPDRFFFESYAPTRAGKNSKRDMVKSFLE